MNRGNESFGLVTNFQVAAASTLRKRVSFGPDFIHCGLNNNRVSKQQPRKFTPKNRVHNAPDRGEYETLFFDDTVSDSSIISDSSAVVLSNFTSTRSQSFDHSKFWPTPLTTNTLLKHYASLPHLHNWEELTMMTSLSDSNVRDPLVHVVTYENGNTRVRRVSSVSEDRRMSFMHDLVDYRKNRKNQDSIASMPTPVLGLYKGRATSRRATRRLIHKDGVCNVSHVNVPKQKQKYFRDIFTTIIDLRWRWSVLLFCAAFIASWVTFSCLYYISMLVHGDFQSERAANHTPCIHNIVAYSYTSVFLFSLETQVTIGYGTRYVSEQCSIVIMLLCAQSLVGLMVQSFMAGIIFAKIARPKKRAETLIFSRNAVINQRDGKLCFMFRVGDMRTSHLVEAHLRVQMIKKRVTSEGELLPFHQFDMNVGYDNGLDRIFLVWPLTICHEIDEQSPLYDYSAKNLATARFEIVVILEGIVESTGMTTQARTSYIPSEILWGHRFVKLKTGYHFRFEKLVTYQRDNGEYRIDYEHFHKTYEIDTPTCSAKDFDLQRRGSIETNITPRNNELSADDLSFHISSPDFRSRTPSSPVGPPVGRAPGPNKWMRNGSLKPEILVQSPSVSSLDDHSKGGELEEVVTA